VHSLLGVTGTFIAGIRSVPQYLIIQHMLTVASQSLGNYLSEETIIVLSAVTTSSKASAEANIIKKWYQGFSPLFSYGEGSVLNKCYQGVRSLFSCQVSIREGIGQCVKFAWDVIQEGLFGANSTYLTLIEFAIASYAISDLNLNNDLEILFYIFNGAGTYAVFDTVFRVTWENLKTGIKTSWFMKKFANYKKEIVLYYIAKFQKRLENKLSPKEIEELYHEIQKAS
jgi:hypothetical protein